MKFALSLLPLAVLSAAPAFTAEPQKAEGGSTQASAQSGCMNQWMFNGVWRVRVTNVSYAPAGDKPNAWNVTMQWGNGTSYAGITPAVDTLKQDMVLALANGDTLAPGDTTSGALNQQQLDYHSFPASGQFTYTQSFYENQTLDQSNKPAKLLITFDVAKYRQYHPGKDAKFWRQKTPGYNYRIDLTCSK
jgi:hypothetical protein